MGDFNGDGKSDLVLTNFAGGDVTGSVSILLGNGDGTFGAAMNYGAGHGPTSVAVGDFNGDGNADLAVGNYHAYPPNEGGVPTSTEVSILLGNGDGTFQGTLVYWAGRVTPGPPPWSWRTSTATGR